MDRRFVGIDVDAQAVETTKARFSEWLNGGAA
jgi:DNA modification methylase